MSKAQQVIDRLVYEKEQELNKYIHENKDVLIPFANLRNELADLKEQQKRIAGNRIANMYKINEDDVSDPLDNKKNTPGSRGIY